MLSHDLRIGRQNGRPWPRPGCRPPWRPRAPQWPPPPSTRHTALASTRGPVRSESFTLPGFSSRSVMPQSVPCTSAARLLSSSTSDSAAPSSRHSARGMDITTTRPLSYSSMSATIRAPWPDGRRSWCGTAPCSPRLRRCRSPSAPRRCGGCGRWCWHRRSTRVRGDGHIQRHGDLRRHGRAQPARPSSYTISPQAAASASRQVRSAKNSWEPWWSMARQIPPFIGQRVVRQQIQRGDVHRYHRPAAHKPSGAHRHAA